MDRNDNNWLNQYLNRVGLTKKYKNPYIDIRGEFLYEEVEYYRAFSLRDALLSLGFIIIETKKSLEYFSNQINDNYKIDVYILDDKDFYRVYLDDLLLSKVNSIEKLKYLLNDIL